MFGAPKPNAAGSLFSSTPAAGASTSLFGQQNQQQQQPAQPATGGSLFGQPQPQQQQPPAGGGLFGAKPSATGGGLFGNTASNTGTAGPASTTGGGLFGQPAPGGAAGAAGAVKPAFGFGNPSTTQPSSGLFGQQNQQQQPATGTGLFGQSQPPAGQQQGTSLFGSTAGQQPSGGLFGQSNAGANQPGQFTTQPFGTSTFNAGAAQAPPQNPFAQFSFSQKERFNALPDQQKQMVEQLDKFIQEQVSMRKQLESSTKDAAEISGISQEIYTIQSSLKSLTALVDSDHIAISDLRGKVEVDRQDSNTMFAIASNSQQGIDNSHLRSFPLNYFARAVAEISGRVTRYKTTMEEIQRQLISIDHRDTYSPDAIQSAIQAQNTSFMALATKVAAVHADIQTLKNDFTRWYQQQHNSLRDPFAMQAVHEAVP